MTPHSIAFCGAVLAGLAVASGAFGAHALETAWQGTPDGARRLETWEVAARYQMYHALGLLAIAAFINQGIAGSLARWSAALMIVGVAIFSGCLYAYALSGWRVLGAIVPLGGASLIVGWLLLAIAMFRSIYDSPRQ